MDSLNNVNFPAAVPPGKTGDQTGRPADPPVSTGDTYIKSSTREPSKTIPIEQVMGIMQTTSPTTLWSFEPYANFVTCNDRSGRAFAASFDRLHCLDKETGGRRWEIPIEGRVQGEPAFTSKGTAIFGIRSGIQEHSLIAVDEQTGKDRWSAGPFEGEISQCAFEEKSGTFFVYTWKGELTAFDAETGRKKWSEHGSASAVVDSDGSTYSVDDKKSLVAIDPGGNKRVLKQGDDTIFRGPLLGPDGTLIVAGYDKPKSETCVVKAYDKKTGDLRWRFAMDEGIGIPEIDAGPDGIIYASAQDRYVTCSKHQMAGLNGRTGEKLWSRQWKSGDFVSSPCFKPGRGGIVFTSDEQHDLRILDGRTGKTIKDLGTGTEFPLDEEGSITYGDDGSLYLRADDDIFVYGADDLLRRLQYSIDKNSDCHYPPLITKDGTALYIDNHHACAARHPRQALEQAPEAKATISIEESEDFVDFGGIRLSRKS